MDMRTIFRNLLDRLGRALGLVALNEQLDEAKMLSAKILINQSKANAPLKSINDAEFKVFSQFGDDGIIQYLVHEVNISGTEKIFVEFGVQDYEESNTRFLLFNNNWRGLILDGDSGNISHVRDSGYFWKYDLTAATAFINRDNINALLQENGFTGEIGLLSIDIDGNDYWVWERIDVIDPIIVVAEYNGVFGPDHAVTVPYDAGFIRSHAHYSNLYWGCSLRALCRLAERKGYVFVGCNNGGNNAYFIKRERIGQLPELSCNEGFVSGRFRESRDKAGELSLLVGADRLNEIINMSVYDLESEHTVSIGKLYKLSG
jgi:hypothetical protein